MSTQIVAYLAAFVVVLVLDVKFSHAQCEILFPKYKVKIINGFEPGTRINVHCKTRDDDMELHRLSTGQAMHFSFRNNIIMTTLFYCYVNWNGKTEHFDAFKSHEHWRMCYDNGCVCPWKLTPHGPCFLNTESSNEDQCFHWKPK